MFVFQTTPKPVRRPPQTTEETPVQKKAYAKEESGKLETEFHRWMNETYPDVHAKLSLKERIRLPSGRQMVLPGEQIFRLKDFYLSLITQEGQTPADAKFWTSQFLERAKMPFYRSDRPAFIEQHALSAQEMMAITRFLWKLNAKNDEMKAKAFDPDHYLEEFAHNPAAGADQGWALLLLDQRGWANQHVGSGQNQLNWLAELVGKAYEIKSTKAGPRFAFNTDSAVREEAVAINLAKAVFKDEFVHSGMKKSDAEKAARELSLKFAPE